MKSLALILLMATSPAFAADCGVFTHETRPPGEVTAKLDGRHLSIVDKYDGTREYDLITAGTGIPFFVAEPVKGDDESFGVRMHKGDLIIDMIAYTPFCP